MKKYLLFFIAIIISIILAFSAGFLFGQRTTNDLFPITENIIPKIDRPLEKYSFENLSKADIKPGVLKIKNILKDDEKFTSYLFEFEHNPNLDLKTRKITTGQINFPKQSGYEASHKFPVVLMFRGYVNQTTFKTGDGTRNAAKYFSDNGFITIAPDFLGYGKSDRESDNIYETRFQSYVTAISLLKYLESNSELKSETGNYNIGNIFIWGHSNGGQIALTILGITGSKHPAVLWAPVSKPFPYSVLYYTDESEDNGKLIRSELSEFEENYDTEKYSLSNIIGNIKSPILLQQGENDEAVPLKWSLEFYSKLKKIDKEITLITYPDTDHNMRPSWNDAVEKDIRFYNSFEI